MIINFYSTNNKLKHKEINFPSPL